LPQEAPTGNPSSFYRDVLPILEQHCQSCHHARGHRPDALRNVRRDSAIRQRHPPRDAAEIYGPWFADPNVGTFSNDPSLRPTEIETLAAWAEAKSPAGETKDVPPARPGSTFSPGRKNNNKFSDRPVLRDRRSAVGPVRLCYLQFDYARHRNSVRGKPLC